MACGLPMLTTDGARRIGLPAGPICRSIARVSSTALASGISCQANRGAPMSTVDNPGASSFQQSGLGLERQRGLAGLLEQQLGDAAHAVAARTRLRAVAVVDADIRVRAGRARRVQGHELIIRRAVGLRGRARLVRGDRAGLSTHVDHHDLVAETVHLHESVVGERAHGVPVVVALYVQAGERGNDRLSAVAGRVYCEPAAPACSTTLPQRTISDLT